MKHILGILTGTVIGFCFLFTIGTLAFLTGCGSPQPENTHSRQNGGSKRFKVEYHYIPTGPDVFIYTDTERNKVYILSGSSSTPTLIDSYLLQAEKQR